MSNSNQIIVIGGGLAGCEAAWMLARSGFRVELSEMRPVETTPAHTTSNLAELVCSNSFRSACTENAVGLLKEEMRALGSLVLGTASRHSVAAGDALAVDREGFSREVTEKIQSCKQISVIRREAASLVGTAETIVATGPLTSEKLSHEIASIAGMEHLYFYDAIAPIVDYQSLDMSTIFAQSRYGKGAGDDYLNCPLDGDAYFSLVTELTSAAAVPARDFEKQIHFSGCMPIEAIAASGPLSLAHGPLKPVGLVDPRTGRRPFAVVQLRRENEAGTAWNLVGCQTKLTYPEQKRVFRMIPGLEKAEFLRLGSMHRNTFLNGPVLLDASLRLKGRENLAFAGQITGVEGYVESAACGMLAGLFAAARLKGIESPLPPAETAFGSLLLHVTSSPWKHFQPSNINYGLFPPLPGRFPPKSRNSAYADRARKALVPWLALVRAVTGGSEDGRPD
jgi:methylenetetrahydrofolate--tRNA-(uracil-5-)-methyltransferase